MTAEVAPREALTFLSSESFSDLGHLEIWASLSLTLNPSEPDDL